jgi:hypothetical protein
LGVKAIGRKSVKREANFILNEPEHAYKADLVAKMDGLSSENMYFWDVFADISGD